MMNWVEVSNLAQELEGIRFWGEIVLKYENGYVIFAKKTETIKTIEPDAKKRKKILDMREKK